MSWYWIVLIIVVGAYLYISIGAALTSVLIDADIEQSYLQDAFWGLIWPFTLLLFLEINIAIAIGRKEDENEQGGRKSK